jgi:hypothetical protein
MTAPAFALCGFLLATTSFGAMSGARSIELTGKEILAASTAQVIVVIGDFTLGAGNTLQVTVTPTTSAPFVTVGGIVTLGNPMLVVINTAPITAGTVITVIRNDGPSPVAGTFIGLPEGSVVTTTTGQLFRISYAGGDGNDVTLTALPTVPLLGHTALMMLIMALALVALRSLREAF